MNESPETNETRAHDKVDNELTETSPPFLWLPFAGLGLAVLVILILSASGRETSTSADGAFTSADMTEEVVETDLGAAGMTVREFARAVERQSWDTAELYAQFGEPIRVSKPHTYHVYLWFSCSDGVAEISCESTDFEMYGALTAVRVETKG